MRSVLRRIPAAFAAAACLPFLILPIGVACATTSASAPAGAEGTLTADEVLARARSAVSKVDSYRFTGEWLTQTGSASQRWTRTGEWAAPDRYRLRFEGIEQTAGQGQELLVIGELGYFRRAGRETWLELDVPPATRAEASGDVVPALSNVAFTDAPQPDRDGLYHLTGQLGAPQGAPDPTVGPSSTVTYALAVRASDFLLDSVVVETRIARFDTQQGVWRTDAQASQRTVARYHDFNAPVTIEAPVALAGGPASKEARVSYGGGGG